jgi:tetratricopeptide (TPR) repeat protein
VRLGLLLNAAALIVTSPASAAWQQASSKHFVIYGDMPADEMKDYAEKLEKFDAAARLVRKMGDPVVGDGNRLQVLVVPTMLDVNRTLGSAEAGVGGYYVGNVSGPYIVTPRKARQILDYAKLEPEVVFFHEYTHHLMLQNTNKPMPSWLTEGFAEFMANPIFNADGSVGLGTPATHRAEYIVKGQFAPLTTMLEGNEEKIGMNGYAFQNYIQGWLMTHYLSFEPSRKGQIDDYVNRISKGEGALAAARSAFGDLGKLESELAAYRHTKRFPYLKIDSTKLTIPSVTVAPMSSAAGEVMMMRIYSKTGYAGLSKGSVLKRVREVAARAPTDSLVQRTLAEVEYDNKNFDEAGAAADAAMKADPNSVEAMMFKGRSYLGKAKKTNDPALFKEARGWFIKGNKVDKEDPEPLYLYYRSYRDANVAAPAGALDALKYAAVLAPRDLLLQVRLTMEYLRQNKMKEARAALEPIAFFPHSGQGTRNKALTALKMIEANDAKGAMSLLEKEMPKPEDDDA